MASARSGRRPRSFQVRWGSRETMSRNSVPLPSTRRWRLALGWAPVADEFEGVLLPARSRSPGATPSASVSVPATSRAVMEPSKPSAARAENRSVWRSSRATFMP
jgi:hypothetical protein